MEISRFRVSLIFWLLAPTALIRRLRRRRAGWIAPDSPERGRGR